MSEEVRKHVDAIEEANEMLNKAERQREVAQTALSLAVKSSTGEGVLELRAITHLVHELDKAKQQHHKATTERMKMRHAVPAHLVEAVTSELKRRMCAWMEDADRIGPKVTPA